MPRRILASALLLSVLVTLFGCGPGASFHAYGIKLPPKQLDAPIGIYPADYILPNNARVIGRLEINGGSLGRNCDLEDAFAAARHKVRQVGGDAVQITTLVAPSTPGGCPGLWGHVFTLEPPPGMPSIPVSEDTIRAHLDSLPIDSNSIVGIWRVDEAQIWRVQGMAQDVVQRDGLYRLALLPSQDSTYAYDGVVLFPNDQGWQAGFVKTRLGRTDDPNVFIGPWYHSDFSQSTVMVTRDKEVRMGFTLNGVAGMGTVEQKVTLFRLYPSR